MQNIIRLMPEALANQIAAGEVVQRPASVVKELLENAVDAKALKIELKIEDGGKKLIQVIDNGTGISPIDAQMAFERHATSKIYELGDLFQVQTMGFRGEALASIAAVAQVRLQTRINTLEIGSLIEIEGGVYKKIEQCTTQIGTSITVKNLFFNVPARRNFLKSNSIEIKHIQSEFIHVAMCYPEIEFKLVIDGIINRDLKATNTLQRINDILEFTSKDDFWELNFFQEDISINGYLGKPNIATKNRNEQYYFVNRRYIRSNYLHHAIMKAYERILSSDQQPIYIISINLPPQQIDINIHPNKSEIKFEKEQFMYTALLNSAIKAITTNQVINSFHQIENEVKNNPITNNPFYTEDINTDLDSIPHKGLSSTGKFSKGFFLPKMDKGYDLEKSDSFLIPEMHHQQTLISFTNGLNITDNNAQDINNQLVQPLQFSVLWNNYALCFESENITLMKLDIFLQLYFFVVGLQNIIQKQCLLFSISIKYNYSKKVSIGLEYLNKIGFESESTANMIIIKSIPIFITENKLELIIKQFLDNLETDIEISKNILDFKMSQILIQNYDINNLEIDELNKKHTELVLKLSLLNMEETKFNLYTTLTDKEIRNQFYFMV